MGCESREISDADRECLAGLAGKMMAIFFFCLNFFCMDNQTKKKLE